jgi:hypothetical protein
MIESCELLPCPFCGVPPEIEHPSLVFRTTIYCGNFHCPCVVKVYASDETEAVHDWNRRAGMKANINAILFILAGVLFFIGVLVDWHITK